MMYCITVMLSIVCMVKKNSKAIFFLFFLFMWIMFAWSFGNADYFAYLSSYNNLSFFNNLAEATKGLEILFTFFNSLGLTYQGFLVIISLICLTIISSSVCKYSSYGGFIFLLYFIYPYLLDIVQIKNFIVTALIVFGVRYLISEKRGSSIRFILIICLATLIHYMAIIFLLLLLVKYFSSKKIILITMVLSLLIIITYKTNLFFIIASKVAPISWITTRLYQGVGDGFVSQILRVVTILFIFGGFIILKKKVIRCINKNEQNTMVNKNCLVNNSAKFKFIDIVSKINILVLITIPLLMFSNEFYRIQQDILILNYTVFSLGFNKSNENKRERAIMVFKMIVYSFILLYIMVLRNNNLFTVFYPAFKNNLLIR